LRKSLVVLSSATLSLLLLAVPASAHVTVHSDDASSGGDDAEIVFRVPNEEGAAKTTKVEIALPADQPIAGVYAENKPGWTVTTKRATLATPIETDDGSITTAVVSVVWTATAGGTGVGQYDDFTLAAGHLPETDEITFKALQTYSNGDVVRWIETGTDAEHPAPVLALGEATGESGHHATTATATVSAAPTVTATQAPVATKAGDDSTAKALGGAGLGLGAMALLVAIGALVRGGRSSAKA
jgi:uncharacterized protein YcnI